MMMVMCAQHVGVDIELWQKVPMCQRGMKYRKIEKINPKLNL
jgi:hypothetical protein